MQRTKKFTKTILLMILAVICFIAGIFVVDKNKQEPLKASAASSVVGFYMESGMALKKTANEPYASLTVYVTSDMYAKLSAPTTTSTGLFGKVKYHPSEYYLRVTQKNSNGEVARQELYHIDPAYAELGARKLEFSSTTKTRLDFTFSSDYATEYTYTCQFMHYTDNYDLPYVVPSLEPVSFIISNAIANAVKPKVLCVAAESSTSVTRSVQYVAKQVVKNETGLTVDQKNWFNYLAGNTVANEQFTVNLKYKKVLSWGQIEEVTEQYNVPSIYAFSEEFVYSQVLSLCGADNITAFNAIYKDGYNSDGIIYLQADGYNYAFNDTTDTGVLTITYRDFNYSNFAIRLQDNDLTNNSNLFLYIRTADVSQDDAGYTYLTFRYSDIVEQCNSGLGWVFDLGPENFVVSNPYAYSANILVHVANDYIKIQFKDAYENQLANVSITATAEIIPDYQTSVSIWYIKLSRASEKSVIRKSSEFINVDVMYSEYIKLCNFDYFKKSTFYNQLCVEPIEGIGSIGKQYCRPISIEGAHSGTDFTLTIGYEYTTLFKFSVFQGYGQSADLYYVACTKNSLVYDINDLGVIAPKSGKRIQDIEKLSEQSWMTTVKFDESAANDFTITLNTSAKSADIIEFWVMYSSTWNLDIEYMETYKETPFAVKQVLHTEISVDKYNPEKLTLKDVKAIMGRSDNMEVCGLVIPDSKVSVEYTSSSTYTVKLTYGLVSLSAIDYSGNAMEIRVPLTSFEDWCKTFGDDLSILYLNKDGEKYFEYSNEIPREDLYGFFTVAVFEEQVSDLNYFFRNNTGKGNVVVFERRETVGSVVYQFFDNLRTKGPLLALTGHVGMAFCEIVNDSNKILHSSFIYLDASDAYISNGGADDKDDNDNALDNTIQDVTDSATKPLEEMTTSLLGMVKITTAVLLGVGTVGAIVFAVVWCVSLIRRTSSGGGNYAGYSGGQNKTKSGGQSKRTKSGKNKKR